MINLALLAVVSFSFTSGSNNEVVIRILNNSSKDGFLSARVNVTRVAELSLLLNSTRTKINDSSRRFSNLTEQAKTIQAQVRASRAMLTGLSERTRAVSETTGLLKNQLDDTLLRHITTMTEVNGDLRVELLCSGREMNQSGSGTGQLVFSSLRVVHGSLFISTSSCPWLKSISFPLLERVRDSIEVTKNRFIERVDFPSLIKTQNASLSCWQ